MTLSDTLWLFHVKNESSGLGTTRVLSGSPEHIGDYLVKQNLIRPQEWERTVNELSLSHVVGGYMPYVKDSIYWKVAPTAVETV